MPFEYFGSSDRWSNFENYVLSTYSDNYKKKDILLRRKFDADDERSHKERTLNDTKFITRFVYNFTNDNLVFAESKVGKKKVVAVNGIITSYMRKIWGINKIRDNGDKHHAIDAAAIAMTTDGMTQRLSKFNKLFGCSPIIS